MDASFRRDSISLTDPGELIALVPPILGFHPTDSLIVVNLNGEDGRMVCAVIRADLPERDDYDSLVRRLTAMLINQDASEAVLLVVTDTEPTTTDGPAHRELLARCTTWFMEAGITTDEWIWASGTTGGSQWCLYDDPAGTGTVPDSARNELIADLPVRPSREDIVATLAPVDDDTLARRAQLLAASTPPEQMGDRLPLVTAAIERAMDGCHPDSDEDVAALAYALTDHAVRDACLAQPDRPHMAAAERLWTLLTCGTPAPERAEPACLLAFAAYQRGDGVLAGIALEIAYDADSEHKLTNLLIAALSIGISPARIRHAGEQAADYAHRDMGTENGKGKP